MRSLRDDALGAVPLTGLGGQPQIPAGEPGAASSSSAILAGAIQPPHTLQPVLPIQSASATHACGSQPPQPVASSQPTAFAMLGGSHLREPIAQSQAVSPQPLQPVVLTQLMALPQVSACFSVFIQPVALS